MKTTSFKVGDTVEWESQAGSYWKKKTGKVEFVVPAGVDVRRITDKLDGPGMARHHESYVVKVGTVGFKYYWPRVSALKKVGK